MARNRATKNPQSPVHDASTQELITELVARSSTSVEAKAWLTPSEVAQLLGVSKPLVYRACREQGLRHSRMDDRPGGVIRIHRQWLEEWLRDRSEVRG